MISNKNIDSGRNFDWGKTSLDYAKYRDIYPQEFYNMMLQLDLCTKGQKVLDLGTGTGVLPRNMYKYGAEFVGVDISENQIEQAKLIAEKNNMNINFFSSPVEKIDFPYFTFNLITACQCFFYFDHNVLAEKLNNILKSNGRLAVLYMAWLPNEDKIANESEKLILKYNPLWSGCGEVRHKISIPSIYNRYFEVENEILFDVNVHFTRESWNGRIKACRGIGASLNPQEISSFEAEHIDMLNNLAENEFDVLHYVAITVLKKRI